MKILLMMLGGIGGDYAYFEELRNNPPPGVSYDTCLPKEFAHAISNGTLKEKIESCDLIHLHSWFPPCDNLYILRFFHNLKTPMLCSFTTTVWDCHRFYWGRTPYVKMAKWLLYSRLIKPGAIIAWSQRARLSAIKQFTCKPEKIYVLPPFIGPRPDNIKDAGQKITIGFIGNDFERKGGPMLLEAFKILKGKYKNLHLNVITDRKIENGPGIKSSVKIERRELPDQFYSDCDIFILPTRADFFSMSILEAMSFGIPVITSNVYAMNEIINDGEDGFLIPPGDLEALLEKMSILIENKDLRKKMGAAAKNKTLQRFNPEITGKALKQIYETCI